MGGKNPTSDERGDMNITFLESFEAARSQGRPLEQADRSTKALLIEGFCNEYGQEDSRTSKYSE